MTDKPFNCTLEDFYTFFLISYFSGSYVGVPEESLYIYRKGVGINQNVILTLRSVNMLPAVKDFLNSRGGDPEANAVFLKALAARLYGCALTCLMTTLKLEPEMMKEAVRCWGSSILLDFIGNLGVFNVKTRDRRQILTRLAKDFLQKHAPPQN